VRSLGAAYLDTTMTERTNEEWLADLRAEPEAQARALNDLQRVAARHFLLPQRERSDLSGLSNHELTQMAEDLGRTRPSV